MATPAPTRPTDPTDRRMTAAEWSAFCDGYERGIQHGHGRGYSGAMAEVLADLRQASHHLIHAGWVPEIVRAVDAAQHRAARASTPATGPDFTDPAAVAAYRARIRASWDLPATRAAPGHPPGHRARPPGPPVTAHIRTTRGAAA